MDGIALASVIGSGVVGAGGVAASIYAVVSGRKLAREERVAARQQVAEERAAVVADEDRRWRRERRTDLYADMLAAMGAEVGYWAHVLNPEGSYSQENPYSQGLNERRLSADEREALRGRVGVFASQEVEASFRTLDRLVRMATAMALKLRVFADQITKEEREAQRVALITGLRELEFLVRAELGTNTP